MCRCLCKGTEKDAKLRERREAVLEHKPERSREPPTFEEFAAIIQEAEGSAGFDGSEASELQVLVKYAPRDKLPKELIENLLTWRVVGIPKTGSTDLRPIAIASVIWQCWHKALPEEQWSEKGVVDATVNWLSEFGRAGAEVHLTKAFDRVPHSAAGTH